MGHRDRGTRLGKLEGELETYCRYLEEFQEFGKTNSIGLRSGFPTITAIIAEKPMTQEIEIGVNCRTSAKKDAEIAGREEIPLASCDPEFR